MKTLKTNRLLLAMLLAGQVITVSASDNASTAKAGMWEAAKGLGKTVANTTAGETCDYVAGKLTDSREYVAGALTDAKEYVAGTSNWKVGLGLATVVAVPTSAYMAFKYFYPAQDEIAGKGGSLEVPSELAVKEEAPAEEVVPVVVQKEASAEKVDPVVVELIKPKNAKEAISFAKANGIELDKYCMAALSKNTEIETVNFHIGSIYEKAVAKAAKAAPVAPVAQEAKEAPVKDDLVKGMAGQGDEKNEESYLSQAWNSKWNPICSPVTAKAEGTLMKRYLPTGILAAALAVNWYTEAGIPTKVLSYVPKKLSDVPFVSLFVSSDAETTVLEVAEASTKVSDMAAEQLLTNVF